MEELAELKTIQRVDTLADILDTVWVVVVVVMVILAQVGFLMKETGSIKMNHNSLILLKTILVIAMSSLTFFAVGFGFSIKAKGGIIGQDNFVGLNYNDQDYTRFIYYLSLCVVMAQIATCSIAERTNTDTYIFFSFVTSGFIFPIGLAWCWNDGWLQNMGFLDHGGASIVHIMGGLAGFIGTYLIGPRVGLFSPDTKLAYLLEDVYLDDVYTLDVDPQADYSD
jgi:Amt family ammonium transporter